MKSWEHDPIPDDDADALKSWFARRGQGSITGSTLDRGALYWLTAEKDEHGHNIPRSFAMPREPVLGSSGQVIGTELALTARITAEKNGASNPGYTPDYRTVEAHAVVSRRIDRMLLAHQLDQVSVLQAYFGPVGHSFETGKLDPETERPIGPALPRIFALLHLLPRGREMLERAKQIDAAPRWKGKTYAQLSEEDRNRLKLGDQSERLLFARMRAKPSDPVFDTPLYEQMREFCLSRHLGRYKKLREPFARNELELSEIWLVAGEAWNASKGAA